MNDDPANPMIAEALAKGEDATGLCTVRGAVQAMREESQEVMELWWINADGTHTRVVLAITQDD